MNIKNCNNTLNRKSKENALSVKIQLRQDFEKKYKELKLK